jgi:hypothetical protein
MGNLIMLCALSQQLSWFQERINSFIALAPVVEFDHSKSVPLTTAAKIYCKMPKTVDFFVGDEVLKEPAVSGKFMRFLCKFTQLDEIGINSLCDDNQDNISP